MNLKKYNLKHKIYIAVLLLVAYICVGLVAFMHDLKPRLWEDSYDGYVTWGASLSEKGYDEASVRALNMAVEMEPESEKAYIQLADVYLRTQQFDMARQVYETALNIIGESYTLSTNLAKIDNVDIQNICQENSVIATTKSEDSFKYDVTRSYNSNGDIVYSYSRTRFYENPDLKSVYVYDDNNRLLREARYEGENLDNVKEYVVYSYDDKGNLFSSTECMYNGHILFTEYYDETGFRYKKAIYDEDNSHYTEQYDTDGYVIANEYFNDRGQLLSYVTYEPWTSSEFSEKITHCNADGSVKYYVIYDYISAIKSIKKETYFTPQGKVIISVQHKSDKHYYVYEGTEYNAEGTETAKYRFYEEASAFVQGYMNAI